MGKPSLVIQNSTLDPTPTSSNGETIPKSYFMDLCIFRVFNTIVYFSFKILHDAGPFFAFYPPILYTSATVNWYTANTSQFHASNSAYCAKKYLTSYLADIFKDYFLEKVFLVGTMAVISSVRCLYSVSKAQTLCLVLWHHAYACHLPKASSSL